MTRFFRYLALMLRNWWSGAPIIDPTSGVTVTLTSHSGRVKHAFAAIESIGSGKLKPARLILYLGRDWEHVPLPASLQRLRGRGLEIRFCEDLGPHTKYYPHLLAESSLETPLVTADDDKMMDADWLATLMACWQREPGHIHCYRAREIKLSNGRIEPYWNWPLCRSDKPSVLHFATGVSGVIYPSSFQKILKEAGDSFRDCCPRADDIWLHVMALRHGYEIQQIAAQSVEFPGIPGMSKFALRRANVDLDGNDRQIIDTYQSEDIRKLQNAWSLNIDPH